MATLDVQQSGGSYSTLNAALAAAGNGDTISIEGSWTIDDTTAATIADDNLTIQTDSSSKHPGYWDESTSQHYRLVQTAGSHALTLSGNYTVTIDGLAIEQASAGGTSDECFRCEPGTSDTVTIKNTILQCSLNVDQQDCLYTGYNKNIGTITLENCILYGAGRAGVHIQNCWGLARSGSIEVNSSVIWNCGRYGSPSNFANVGAGISITGRDTTAGDMSGMSIDVHNSVVVENDTGGSSEGEDPEDFSEAFHASTTHPVWGISYSMDSDNTIATVDGGGSGNLASHTATDSSSPGSGTWVVFEDITSAPYDLRLADNAENDAQDAHTTATAEGLTIPSTDIVGTSRPQNTSHDMGAFEIVAASGYTLTAAYGSLTFAGQTVGTVADRQLVAVYDTFTFSGQTVALKVDRTLTAAYGSLSLSGQAVDLVRDYTLTAAAGTLSFAGQDVTLTYSGSVGHDDLVAAAGSLTFTGQAVGLDRDYTLVAASGSLTFAGQTVTITTTRKLTASYGSLTFAGQTVTITTTRSLTASYGSLSFAGQVVTLDRDYTITAAYGSLTFAGQDTDLDYSGAQAHPDLEADYGSIAFLGMATVLDYSNATVTPDERIYIIAAESRTWTIPEETRTMVIAAEDRTMIVVDENQVTD